MFLAKTGIYLFKTLVALAPVPLFVMAGIWVSTNVHLGWSTFVLHGMSPGTAVLMPIFVAYGLYIGVSFFLSNLVLAAYFSRRNRSAEENIGIARILFGRSVQGIRTERTGDDAVWPLFVSIALAFATTLAIVLTGISQLMGNSTWFWGHGTGTSSVRILGVMIATAGVAGILLSFHRSIDWIEDRGIGWLVGPASASKPLHRDGTLRPAGRT